ncbi:MAG: hypothetical protein JW384_02136 [Nitrosomonadaceae bacterium]|nr:hypothetical protein [Nitrosomonadaceae bacterium]
MKSLLLAVALVVVVACSGSDAAPGTATSTTSTIAEETTTSTTSTIAPILTVFDQAAAGLTVGDCFDARDIAVKVACESLHDGQVIATAVYLDSSLEETVQSALWIRDAEEKCSLPFKEFVGYDYNPEKGRFLISLLVEDASASLVTCTVLNSYGERWAGSAKNFVGSYQGVSVGDCFMFPTEINDAIVVDCAESHDGEMFLRDVNVGITRETSPYPSRGDWGDIANRICEKPFVRYTGASLDDEVLSYSYIYPLKSDWGDIKERTLSCIANSYSGEQLSYSVRK